MPDSPADYRAIWNAKPVLRAIYEDIYARMLERAAPGPILEIGGGSGNFKAFAPDAVSTDIVSAPWLDLVCDAQRLPFGDARFANVAMVDVLHHIENPLSALREFARVLKPGGRLVLCEPAITPLSGIFYRHFHPEPVDMTADPLGEGAITPGRDPFESNQAIPTLLAGRDRERFAAALPAFRLTDLERFSFLAYPLSGGFRSWSLMPAALAKPLLDLEWAMRGAFGRLAAFRMLAVYERV